MAQGIEEGLTRAWTWPSSRAAQFWSWSRKKEGRGASAQLWGEVERKERVVRGEWEARVSLL
jgi:hypothetical protein